MKAVPASVRKAARAVLPARVVDAAKAKIIYLLYERNASTVQRGSRPTVFLKRRVLRRKPTLYHLDVHVTDHCNMRCRGCSHFSNISKAGFADLDEFTSDFNRMAQLFDVAEIFLLGGEPLLHPHVADFVRVAHAAFPKAKTYLFTNSLLVPRMRDEVWRALAETGVVLYCDDYPVELERETIDELAAAHGARIKWTEPRSEFFTIPIDVDGTQDAAESFAACSGVDNCVNLRHGRLYPCARIAYIDIFREHFGIEGLAATDADSISIYGEADAWRIMDFLLSPVPWCRHCDQKHVEWYPWGRGEQSIEQWTCPSECPPSTADKTPQGVAS